MALKIEENERSGRSWTTPRAGLALLLPPIKKACAPGFASESFCWLWHTVKLLHRLGGTSASNRCSAVPLRITIAVSTGRPKLDSERDSSKLQTARPSSLPISFRPNFPFWGGFPFAARVFRPDPGFADSQIFLTPVDAGRFHQPAVVLRPSNNHADFCGCVYAVGVRRCEVPAAGGRPALRRFRTRFSAAL